MQDNTYKLAIKIAGEIEKSFYDAAKTTKKEMLELAKTATFIQAGIKNSEPFFSGLESMAVTSFKAVVSAAAVTGTAITAALGASVHVGSEFESAFAGVKKTVTATDAELAQMRDEIRQMAKEIPQSAAELSGIAEAAGQLGIENQNLMEFTQTMANMEVATNLTSEEAATEFAQFANITGMAQDNFDNLGSSVVALGNTMATNEASIVSMGMRIAAAGDQVNLTEAEIMAYASSLSSVGIEAVAGGTAFSKLLVNLQMAAETGEQLKQYAKVAGMTGAEFKKLFQDDASDAINAFLSGLNNTERNGKSAIAVLTDMGITEVRLRDTLIRAAGASEMFGTALETSDEAWQENTALVNEAAQRYATFENQCGILGNKITDIGISVYDDLRPGLTEVVMLANQFVDGLAGQENVVEDVIDSAVKGMPTMIREMREAGEAVREFTEPFLKVGGWLVENPGVITGTIVGVGTALGTYKIATGIASLAASLGSLGPVGIGILGLGGVAGIITGIATAVKKSAAEAKQANLDAHFGNIALSIQDIQEAASFIVGNESLEQMRESMEAMAELDGLESEIRDISDEIRRTNWKVSIGMELSELEMEDYKGQLEEYCTSVQEYVTQQQYAITLSVNTLLGEDIENSNIVTQMNEFYAGKQEELKQLGEDLNEAITDAFNDGLLEPDEVEIIENLRKQIAEIKAALSDGDGGLEAELDLLDLKYSNNLDADSTMNLFAEINRIGAERQAGYDEDYKNTKAQWNQMKNEMPADEFMAGEKDLDAAYLQRQWDLWQKLIEFENTKAIAPYAEEFDTLTGEMDDVVRDMLGYRLNSIAYEGADGTLSLLAEDVIGAVDIDQATRDAMAEVFEQMKPALEATKEIEQKYKEMGVEIPEEMREEIKYTYAIGALAGDIDAMWGMIGVAAESEEYQQAISAIAESGGYLPEQIAVAIAGNQDKIDAAVMQSWNDTKKTYEMTFGQGLGTAAATGSAGERLGSGFKFSFKSSKNIPGHADGGIFDTPHLALFAEDGPEAAIPLDGSRNSIDLWTQTGKLLGMDRGAGRFNTGGAGVGDDSGSSIQILYNPTLQFYGGAPSKEDIEDAMETEYDKFVDFMERFARERERFGFA